VSLPTHDGAGGPCTAGPLERGVAESRPMYYISTTDVEVGCIRNVHRTRTAAPKVTDQWR
jgi:hypothetical protein